MLSMLIRAATVVHSISTHAFHAFPCYLHGQVKHRSMGKHGKDGDSMEFPWTPCFSPCFFYQGSLDIFLLRISIVHRFGTKSRYQMADLQGKLYLLFLKRILNCFLDFHSFESQVFAFKSSRTYIVSVQYQKSFLKIFRSAKRVMKLF